MIHIKFIYVVIFLLLYSYHCYPATITTYFETSQKSVNETLEEEDDADDDELTSTKYMIKVSDEFSRNLDYTIKYLNYNKDYSKQDSLDNRSELLNIVLKHSLEILKLNLNTSYKEKTYNNSPSLEYEQIKTNLKLTYDKPQNYSLFIAGGANNYEFRHSGNDMFKKFISFGGGFYPFRTFDISSSIYLQDISRSNLTDRSEVRLNLGTDYKANLKYLHTLSVRLKKGRNQTIEEEERNDIYDYDFLNWYIRTEHRLTKKFKTFFKYKRFSKDYSIFDHDHRGFMLEHKYRYELFRDRYNFIYSNLYLAHKRTDYLSVDSLDYKKNSFAISGAWTKIKAWKISLGLGVDDYKYHASSAKDKTPYFAELFLNRYFLENMQISLHYKHKVRNYEEGSDTEQDSVRIQAVYEF